MTRASSARTTTKEALPVWDLTDFYPSHESAELKADMDWAEQSARRFQQNYQGNLASLTGDGLAKAIQDYEALQDRLGKIGSYAQLLYCGDMQDEVIGRFYQNSSEKLNDISAHLIFFGLELNQIPDTALQTMQSQSPALAHYAPWLRDVRVMKPYQLSEKEEAILHEKHITGAASWVRLYDESLTALRFTIRGQDMGLEEALHCLSEPEAALRRDAAKEIGRVFVGELRHFTTIMNVLVKDKAIDDRLRGFAAPISARNLANFVEDDVVAALLKAVRESYPHLSHRYYRWKAKNFGQKQLDYWDRNAPFPDATERQFSWDAAKKIVLDAYGRFSPRLAELGQEFFDKPWIDVPARPGKATGAFAHPTVPSVHPYLLLNYQGRLRDVMTLAHELGHGVHQRLAAGQGALMADTPLTLAETASVFGEQLTFRALLDAEKDPKQRRYMLAAKVEDMLNTVVRQVAFCEFERRIHDARQQGELSSDDICDHWLAVQQESLGDAIRFDEEYCAYWAYISHFIHSPFYVYAYAFGDCLVNALYTAYQEQPEGFAERYLTMLAAGGTLHHRELLAPFGLNAADPAFWRKGLGVIAGFIDELERV